MYIDVSSEEDFGHSFENLVNPNPTYKSQSPIESEAMNVVNPTRSEKVEIKPTGLGRVWVKRITVQMQDFKSGPNSI